MKGARKLLWLAAFVAVAAAGATYRPIRGLLARRARERAAGEELARRGAAVRDAPNDPSAHWYLADALRRAGRDGAAVEEYAAVVRLEPDNQTARLAYANQLLGLHRLGEAEGEYRILTARWPRLAVAWDGQAISLHQQRKHLEALRAAERSVALEPEDPNHQFVHATAAVEHAMQFPDPMMYGPELAAARRELQHLRAVWPDREVLYIRSGLVEIGSKDFGPAVPYLEQAIRLAPGDREPRELLARALLESGRRPEALRVVEAALRRWPDDAMLCDLQGQLLQSSPDPGSPQRALGAYQTAVRLDPHNPVFLERLGSQLARMGRLDEAIPPLEEATRGDARPGVYQQLATIYTRKGDSTRAARAARAAIQGNAHAQEMQHVLLLLRAHPDRTDLHLKLADDYRRRGMSAIAREEYLRVRELDPRNAAARTALAQLPSRTTP